MAHTVMAYIVVAYMVMAYIVMADIVMAGALPVDSATALMMMDSPTPSSSPSYTEPSLLVHR